MSERSISFPFTVRYGSVQATTDPSKVWTDRVLSAISTGLGERPMRDAYGTVLGKMVWANRDDASEIASEQVRVAFQKHLPYLSLVSTEVYETYQEDLLQEALEVEVSFILPNGEEITAEAVIGTIDRTGEYVYTTEAYLPVDRSLPDDVEAP